MMTLFFRCLHSKALWLSWLLASLVFFSSWVSAQEAPQVQEPEAHVARLVVDGPIGPATTDYLSRSLEQAYENGARLAVLQLDTPGGLDASTRDIVKLFLDSPIPIVTYVHPSGARAASAGTFILYASHIAAMTPATTLGAATPVQMGGGGFPGAPEDQEQEREREQEQDTEEQRERDSAPSGNAMERKVINDAVAFIRGLAERHGRNADWAERAVREAATLTASEALAQEVVDVVAENMEDLLAQIDGRTVEMKTGPATVSSADLPVRDYTPDWRNEFLALITNPQVAYILLLIGIYGLIFEGYNPGALVPGVVGLISLLLGLYALQVLPVNYAGLALMVAGILLIVAEVFMPSFGILGIGGIIALVIGSIMLIDTDVPGMEMSYQFIAAIAVTSGLFMLFLLTVAGKTLRMPKTVANQALVGRTGTVVQAVDEVGQIRLDGELWQAQSEVPLQVGQTVTVVAQDGLHLQVRPINEPAATAQ